MTRTIAAAVFAFFFSLPAAAIDLATLWDFSNPSLSERRFEDALRTATGDDVLILQTQIARTYALRKDFRKARAILQTIEPRIGGAGAEVQVRYWLELGRTYASHRHPPESLTPETKALARSAFTKALDLATAARLDGLAIDAIHMFPFVDTAPEAQLAWGRKAVALVEASNQPEAKRWEASARSNLGETLYDLGRFDEALAQFQRTAELREQGTNPAATRDAYWHVARVLRRQGRIDEALAIQHRLERESEAAAAPRHYVYEELSLLYGAMGCAERSQHYLERANAIKK